MGRSCIATNRARKFWSFVAPKKLPAPEVHPFVLAKAENGYMDALATRSSMLTDQRRAFMSVLFRSNRGRFAGRAQEMISEMGEVAARVLRDRAAQKKEAALIEAAATLFYSEMEG